MNAHRSVLKRRINRNIVECKAVFGNGQVFAYIVLIETLWNVKTE